MDVLSRWLTICTSFISVLLLTYSNIAEYYEFYGTFMAVVGLTGSEIVEKSPTILNITLAVGIQVMARCWMILVRDWVKKARCRKRRSETAQDTMQLSDFESGI